MAQSMRPISTVTDTGNFTGPSAHGSVDGTAPDTGDYWNGDDNQNDELEVLLTDLSGSTPGSGTCTVDIYQAESDGGVAPASGGGSPSYDIEIFEGATQRAVRAGITATESTFTQDNVLTFASGDITDWSDVRVRFTSTGAGGSPDSRRGVAVSFIEVTTPDAAAGEDVLLADDVESASEVTAPAVGQTHVLLADDVESASEVGAPALGQEHVLLADDVESASEVSTPVASESNILLADDIESASEVTAPAVGQEHVLLADDVESASEVGTPAVGQEHVLLADDVESASEVGNPVLSEISNVSGSGSPQAETATSSGVAVGANFAIGSPQAETATSSGAVVTTNNASGSPQAETATASGAGTSGSGPPLSGIPAGFFSIPNCIKDIDFRGLMRVQAEGAGVWAFWVAGVDLGSEPVPKASATLKLNISLIQNEAEGTATWARWAPGTQAENTGNLQLNMVLALNAGFVLS